MAQRSKLSLERKLQRELKHRAWLANHLPQSAQYRACQRRVLVLRTELATKDANSYRGSPQSISVGTDRPSK